jgi:cytochrome c553
MVLIGRLVQATETVAGDATVPVKVTNLCKDCHGLNGVGIESAGIPRIAGQTAGYLQKQLRDYANGTRVNPIMSIWAKQLSATEQAEVTEYYSSVNVPSLTPTANPLSATDPLSVRGRQLALQGSEAQRVQACANCHGPEGRGVPQAAPYLAGQWATYLRNALLAWQDGTRHNDPGQLMASVASRLSNADVDAVTAYYSSLSYFPQ